MDMAKGALMEDCRLNNIARTLKIGALLALVGPLPGYAVFAFKNFAAAGNVGEALRLFVYFYGAALLLFGWYCFLIGAIGCLVHQKLTASRPARTGAVVALAAASVIPIILMEGSATRGLGIAALVSAAFWTAAYLTLAVSEAP